MPDRRHERIEAGLVLVASIWAGMLLGVSFLATPAKFAAPGLTLPVALDVGRHTFGVFNPVEIVAAGLVLGLAVLARRRRVMAPAALLAVIVALQTVWLLPVLDARVETIIAGGTVSDSPVHGVYVVLEVAKLLALLTVAVALAFRRGADEARRHRGSGVTTAAKGDAG